MNPSIEVEGMSLTEAYSELVNKTVKTGRLKDKDGNWLHEYALVRFFPRSDPRDIETVFIGVNGKAYQIKRGEIVPVPSAVIGVAENAQVPVYTTDSDGVADRKILAGYRPAYPFEAICGITREEADKLKALMAERAAKRGKPQDGKLFDEDILEYRMRPVPKTGKKAA